MQLCADTILFVVVSRMPPLLLFKKKLAKALIGIRVIALDRNFDYRELIDIHKCLLRSKCNFRLKYSGTIRRCTQFNCSQ